MDANQLAQFFYQFFIDAATPRYRRPASFPTTRPSFSPLPAWSPSSRSSLATNPPWSRATSVQKCFRTVDIDIVGSTQRHCTFFEMLGNFSFGDYFKAEAIPFAWELVTEVLGIDGDRLWITVHETDDEAEQIWADAVGVPARSHPAAGGGQLLADGGRRPMWPELGDLLRQGGALRTPGGPAHGGEERFVELWNLVFMQLNQLPDGRTEKLPRPSIDTGAGLERILPIVQGLDSIFDTDLFVPMIDAAQSITGRTYGADERQDVGLRIMADHGRAMSMLVADGVLPSNEGRGYVLRRVIRRAVRRARQLGVERCQSQPDWSMLPSASSVPPTPSWPSTIVWSPMWSVGKKRVSSVPWPLARPSSKRSWHLVPGHSSRRCCLPPPRHLWVPGGAHRRDGRRGGGHRRPGRVRGGHGRAASLARAAARAGRVDAGEAAYRAVLDAEGQTLFVGNSPDGYSTPARVVAVLADPDPEHAGQAEIFLDRTPFYAEGGGQMGDTGNDRHRDGYRPRLRHGGRGARADRPPGQDHR